MNLISNLQTLLKESESYFDTVTEEKGKTIITLKYDVIRSFESHKAFFQFFNALKKKLKLEPYIEQKYIIKPTRVPGIDYALPLCQRIEFHVDTIALHTDRLRGFFQYGVTKSDVAESMSFLLQNGWTEKEFQSEIGLSRSSYFRYLPKNVDGNAQSNQPEPPPTVLNG